MKDSAKAFRSLYQRPYFMPQTVEISDTNWIFVSKGSLEHHFDVIEKKEFDFLKKLKSLTTTVLLQSSYSVKNNCTMYIYNWFIKLLHIVCI